MPRLDQILLRSYWRKLDMRDDRLIITPSHRMFCTEPLEAARRLFIWDRTMLVDHLNFWHDTATPPPLPLFFSLLVLRSFSILYLSFFSSESLLIICNFEPLFRTLVITALFFSSYWSAWLPRNPLQSPFWCFSPPALILAALFIPDSSFHDLVFAWLDFPLFFQFFDYYFFLVRPRLFLVLLS